MYSTLAVADAAYDAYKLSQLHYITLEREKERCYAYVCRSDVSDGPLRA